MTSRLNNLCVVKRVIFIESLQRLINVVVIVSDDDDDDDVCVM